MMCPMDAHVAPAPGALPRAPVVRLRLAGDERLASLAGGGSEAAFAVLFQRFSQPLYRYCRSLLGNDADAQDALQTAFTQALVALREDRRTAPVRPWLYRIAHNESVSLLRRRRPMLELPDDGGAGAGPSPEEVVDERARLQTLIADLQELPARQRGALVMRELSGLPHVEIAQAFDISVGAAKQTVLEARCSLQEFAEGRSMACEEIQRVISDGDRRALRGRRVRAHLRGCGACRAFADAIPVRRAELRALSPALPGATAAGLLARITGMGSGHAGGGAGVAAGATGKAVGLAASTKVAVTGAAVVAAAAVGVGEIHHLVTGPTAAAGPRSSAAGRSAPGVRPRPHIGYSGTVTRAHRAAAAMAPAAGLRAAGHRIPGRRVGTRHRTGHVTVAAVGSAAVVVSPRSSLRGSTRAQTTGQGSAHRATRATATRGVASSTRGASATAPGHTGQTGQARRVAVQSRSASPATASTHGNSSHAGSGPAVRGNGTAGSSGAQAPTANSAGGQTNAGKAAK